MLHEVKIKSYVLGLATILHNYFLKFIIYFLPIMFFCKRKLNRMLIWNNMRTFYKLRDLIFELATLSSSLISYPACTVDLILKRISRYIEYCNKFPSIYACMEKHIYLVLDNNNPYNCLDKIVLESIVYW
jgi:hypothetical protein